VKLFLSEDCPSKVNKKSQDHLQARALSIRPSTTNEYDDLPPGFEGKHFQNQPKAELSHISQIKWQCPPLFALKYDWLVVAGEGSEEKHDQKLREIKVLEAVYPRISAIPPRPCVSSDVEKECYDDSLTPLIPLNPIDEEESLENIQHDAVVTKHADSPTKLQSQRIQQYIPAATSPIYSHCNASTVVSSSSEMDLVAASAAVAAAILKSNDQGSNIDMDLLLKIVNDPIMIEKLTDKQRTATTTVSISSNGASVVTPPVPLSSPTLARHAISIHSVTRPTPSPHMHRPVNKNIPHMPNGVLPSLSFHPSQQGMKRTAPLDSVSCSELNTVRVPSPSANMHPVAKQARYTTAGSVPSQPGAVKDVNYYKNLIRIHGTDKQNLQDSRIGVCHNNFQDLKRPRNNGQVKPKIQKPCIYFNTSKGCRNGSNCPYQHDMSVQQESGNVQSTQNAKRLKLESRTIN
ncbi:Zinc finger CCCH domain-containing protein 30, partial [Mucuna pruriens]